MPIIQTVDIETKETIYYMANQMEQSKGRS